jgi:hypothetical protein
MEVFTIETPAVGDGVIRKLPKDREAAIRMV